MKLIRKGKAYVCDLSAEEIREYRGTLKEPGKDSPYRNRSVEENLTLFEGMKMVSLKMAPVCFVQRLICPRRILT